MTLPQFQVYECTSNECGMRFSTDLSIKQFDFCPVCKSPMQKSGQPYSNYSYPHFNPNTVTHDLVVVLDNIRSTLNVGSIFRTADGTGVKHIYCCGTTPTPEHSKIKKTSLGAELLTPWSHRPNGFLLVSDLKSSGSTILAFEATESSKSIFDEKVSMSKQPIALVFGNEISGIDPAILGIADQIIAIPMSGSKTSLNVAVAAGIAIYTIINPKIQINHKSENG